MRDMSAEEKLAKAVAAHQQAEHDVQVAAIDAIRELVHSQEPGAKFFTMVDSDQGPYLAAHRAFDQDGNLLTTEISMKVLAAGWSTVGTGSPR